MPNELKKQIKNRKTRSALITTLGLFLAILIGLEIEAFVQSANIQIKVVLGVLALICLMIWICLFSAKQSSVTLHQIQISYVNKESLIAAFNANQIMDDTYIVFRKKDDLRLRMLLQFIPRFDKEVLAKQRKNANKIINKQYNIKGNLPLYDALKMLRINLVICEEMSDSVLHWVERDTAKLMGRNESIINAAVVIKQRMLLLPDCPHGATYIEIRKYELAVKILCSSLISI